MADETTNQNEQQQQSAINIGDDGAASGSSNADLTSDPILSKHLDIAIEAQDGKAATADTQTPSGEKKDDADKPTDKKDSASGGDDKSAQQQPEQKGKKEEKPTAGPKDLKLPDGTVVKGGPERRFYEQLQTSRAETTHLREQLGAAQQQLQTARQELQTTQQAVQEINGIAPNDLAIATRIFTDLQRDPVGAVRKMLAELVANGHTVEGIGQGVDVAAITRAIEARVAPLQAQNAQPSEADIVREAEQEVQQFYTSFPDARPHDALLARMLRDNPGVDLSAAYFQLRNAFAERGYDWSLSLEDNLKAQSGDLGDQQQQPSQQTKPLVNGRAPETGIEPASKTVVAHENADMGDIVKEAMREQGLNV